MIVTRRTFDEYLSRDVVDLLVATYAERLPELGTLSWEYGSLPSRVWGRYDSIERRLVVNRSRTRGLFRQQVETILHEIRHWNQDVEAVLEAGDVRAGLAGRRSSYEFETRCVGYRRNRFEVDAREFAAAKLDEAIRLVSDALSGRVEGGLEDALEELVEDLAGERTTRGAVGRALAEYRLNTRENLETAIRFLRELGIEVR